MYGSAGPGTSVNRSIRNAMSPTHEDPSNSSGRVPAGSRGATASDGTRQCRKLTRTQSCDRITRPVSGGATAWMGSTRPR